MRYTGEVMHMAAIFALRFPSAVKKARDGEVVHVIYHSDVYLIQARGKKLAVMRRE